jgi:hypothetical protein
MVIKKKTDVNKKDTNNSKKISFTYVGKETKFITKFFINTNINISYKTKNTIEKLLPYKQQDASTNIMGRAYMHKKFQTVVSDIWDKLKAPLILDLKNTFSLINIKIKIPYLHNIFKSIIILLDIWKMLMAVVQVVRKGKIYE